MKIRIYPGPASGRIRVPSSKSLGHRAALCAMLARGESLLTHLPDSQDMDATLDAAALWGAQVERRGDTARIVGDPAGSGYRGERVFCRESGSTLRFLIPIALAVAGGGHFTGQGRLMERPQQPYFDIFQEKGIAYDLADGTLTIRGQLTSGVYTLPGNVSSQFVTGLLYALPLLEEDSEIHITSPLESKGYVDMTLDTLKYFGVQVENLDYETFCVPGGQVYRAQDITIEADWSQAAFWYAANFLDNPVDVQGMNAYSVQGDMIVAKYYWLLARPGEAVEIDLSGCPDLLPPLAVMAAVRSGTTRFTNGARLRIKESDRLSTVHQMLTALGGQVEEGPDSLTVIGGKPTGGTVDGANDHRIVMAAAIAATACTEPVTILGAEAVSKSYPDFFNVYKSLGGDIHVL